MPPLRAINPLQSKEGARLHGPELDRWRRWGPYLSERQWGTVREDYSEYGTAWDYFPHDQARSRMYRWGEDGIAGFGNDPLDWCVSLALWNGHDPIIKNRATAAFARTSGWTTRHSRHASSAPSGTWASWAAWC
jgi:hypothetical protein